LAACSRRRTGGSASRRCRPLGRIAGEPLSVTPAGAGLQPAREATVDERGTRPDRIVVSIDLMSLLDARAPHRVRLRNHAPAPPPHPLPETLLDLAATLNPLPCALNRCYGDGSASTPAATTQDLVALAIVRVALATGPACSRPPVAFGAATLGMRHRVIRAGPGPAASPAGHSPR
jgi:hypothetical protein